MSTDREKARSVLEGVLREVDFGPDPPTAVLGAWVDGPETICIVFEKEDFDGVLGLRRVLEREVPVDPLVLYISFQELGEPLGGLEDELVLDDHGIHWFSGDHPEWRDYSLWSRH